MYKINVAGNIWKKGGFETAPGEHSGGVNVFWCRVLPLGRDDLYRGIPEWGREYMRKEGLLKNVTNTTSWGHWRRVKRQLIYGKSSSSPSGLLFISGMLQASLHSVVLYNGGTKSHWLMWKSTSDDKKKVRIILSDNVEERKKILSYFIHVVSF